VWRMPSIVKFGARDDDATWGVGPRKEGGYERRNTSPRMGLSASLCKGLTPPRHSVEVPSAVYAVSITMVLSFAGSNRRLDSGVISRT